MTCEGIDRVTSDLGEIAENFIVAWFESLLEEEKREYDKLAEAGRLYGDDPEAEVRAFEDGTHPLLEKP